MQSDNRVLLFLPFQILKSRAKSSRCSRRMYFGVLSAQLAKISFLNSKLISRQFEIDPICIQMEQFASSNAPGTDKLLKIGVKCTFSRDIDNSVGIDIKSDFNLGLSSRQRGDTDQLE